jgi:hypothetical protein
VAKVTQILQRNGWHNSLKPHTTTAMKRWAFVVAGLYSLILVVLTVPVTRLAFAPKANAMNLADAHGYPPCWHYEKEPLT